MSPSQEAAGQFATHLTGWSLLLLAIPLVSSGRIDGVYLAALVLLSQAAFEAFQPLPQAAQQIESSIQAAGRLFAVADAEPQVKDPPHAAQVPQTPHIALRELSFRYNPNELPALEDVSLDVPPGARVAIVGPSGAGKSTLVNLLLRFWEYEQGQIYLGPHELKAYGQEDVRALFSVIDQRTHLFRASIYDNIRLARPGASRRDVEEAAKRALLHQFVVGLPGGYETVIGERGAQLSGGQRQRVALARALLRNSSILILDEPTANLDPHTENVILKTTLDSTRDRTILLITHRLVNLQHMDEIVVLRQGRIVERGKHRQLLNRPDGLYHHLWQLQQGKPAAATAAAMGQR